MTELLKPGQSIQLVVADGASSVGASAVVLRITKDSIFVSQPSFDGQKLAITASHVIVFLPLADAIYSMRVKVLAVEGAGVRLEKPSTAAVQRIQRREFARSPIGAPCFLAIVAADGTRERAKPAQLLDLSGGGASTMQGQAIDVGTKVYVRFDIPGDGEIDLLGTVVRSSVIDSLSGKRHSVGISFSGLDERTRSRIIRYVFSMQRELTRWGKQFR